MTGDFFDRFYAAWLSKKDLTPEEKLAKKIVEDWLLLMKRGWPLSEYRREFNWPDTESARFWVEEVLEGDIGILKMVRDHYVEERKRRKKKAA